MIVQALSENDTLTLFYSGGEKRKAGVGFMADSRTAKSVILFQPTSGCVAVLTVNGTIRTHIILVYAPTKVSSDSTKDNFYDQLEQTFDFVPQTDVIILAGDLNVHIGTNRTR